MSQDPAVARRRVEITNPYGLHLRPAEKFVGAGRPVPTPRSSVRHQGRDFNGKSILDLMTLAAECGTWLEVEARGPDAEAAVAALAELVAARFGEAPGSPGTYPPPGEVRRPARRRDSRR